MTFRTLQILLALAAAVVKGQAGDEVRRGEEDKFEAKKY